MRKTLIHLGILFGLVGLSASAFGSAGVEAIAEDVDEGLDPLVEAYDPVAEEFIRRAAEIRAELDEGSAPEWAGEYHFDDGPGANLSLMIAPDHGFASIWSSRMGIYGRSFGTVTQMDGRLRLNHETNPSVELERFSNVLVPVLHEGRRYLVGEEQLGEFLDAARAGFENCSDACARFLLRNINAVAPGMPKIPPDERFPFIPVFARVTTIIEPDLENIDGQFHWRKAKVELDVGRNEGVWEGMEFYSSTAGWITDTITVVKVRDTSAIAEVSAYEMQPIAIRSGTCVSNYYDDDIEKRVDGRPQTGCDAVAVAGY